MKYYPTRPNWEKEFTEETVSSMFKMVGTFMLPAIGGVLGLALHPQLMFFKIFLVVVALILVGFLIALYLNRKNLKKEYLARIAEAKEKSVETPSS